MEGIFKTLMDAALLQKAGSGLGFPLHLMRPAGEVTKTSFGSASGPVSFLHVSYFLFYSHSFITSHEYFSRFTIQLLESSNNRTDTERIWLL